MDLSIFCSKRQSHAARLSAPWSFGDFTYASDGHILIRVPRTDAPENDEAPKVWKGDFASMFSREPSEWVAVPAVGYKGKSCAVCNGTAEAFMCPECEGEGVVFLSTRFNDYGERNCKTCKSAAVISKKQWGSFVANNNFKGEAIMVPCDACNETGLEWVLDHKFINGVKVNEKFLWMVGALPGARLGTFGVKDAVRFKFDGGDGLIMPMMPDKEEP